MELGLPPLQTGGLRGVTVPDACFAFPHPPLPPIARGGVCRFGPVPASWDTTRFVIENHHRELKQNCGVENCAARSGAGAAQPNRAGDPGVLAPGKAFLHHRGQRVRGQAEAGARGGPRLPRAPSSICRNRQLRIPTLIADFRGRENNQAFGGPAPPFSGVFFIPVSPILDCFLGPTRCGRLRICIRRSLSVSMIPVGFSRLFQVRRGQEVVSTLVRLRFWGYAPRRFRAGK